MTFHRISKGLRTSCFGALLLFATSLLHADFESAADSYRAKDYLRALEEFQPLAEQGDPRAQTVLALMHKYGEGTSMNLETSYDWYRKAAELGYAPAQYHAGVMLAEGVGAQPDPDAALKWLTMSAEAGFARANDKLEALNASSVSIDSPVDEFIPWSQSWDFKLPTDIRLGVADDASFSSVASIPNYRVQLGAMSTKDAAEQLWLILNEHSPALFEGLSLLATESITPGRTIYRVQTGPFDTPDQARSFCTDLVSSSARAIGCLVLHPTP
ncbi:MAG: hypothetical protein CMQ19_05855 [Gammaproteobacteria bacterium]|jgi:hypothetical protein|nr:hypothetical protein [Gammaproteobacteria bacterium]|tara:strand:- start:713 stop:1525 length:813 start_codon:yes stop_codon:yes gene_type:complete